MEYLGFRMLKGTGTASQLGQLFVRHYIHHQLHAKPEASYAHFVGRYAPVVQIFYDFMVL